MREWGLATITSPERVVHLKTYTCVHCNRVRHVKPKVRPEDSEGFCTQCMAPICAACTSKPCVPFEKKLEIAEARYHARRSYGF